MALSPVHDADQPVMLYAARDEPELKVLESLVRASHAFARPA